jgi:hypothetical protein
MNLEAFSLANNREEQNEVYRHGADRGHGLWPFGDRLRKELRSGDGLRQKTGIFFHEPTEGSLLEAVNRSEKIRWDVDRIREHARKFDVSITRENLESFIVEKYQEFHRSLDLDINEKGYRKIIYTQVENQVLDAHQRVLQSKIQ